MICGLPWTPLRRQRRNWEFRLEKGSGFGRAGILVRRLCLGCAVQEGGHSCLPPVFGVRGSGGRTFLSAACVWGARSGGRTFLSAACVWGARFRRADILVCPSAGSPGSRTWAALRQEVKWKSRRFTSCDCVAPVQEPVLRAGLNADSMWHGRNSAWGSGSRVQEDA
jgi:hypothetical protein